LRGGLWGRRPRLRGTPTSRRCGSRGTRADLGVRPTTVSGAVAACPAPSAGQIFAGNAEAAEAAEDGERNLLGIEERPEPRTVHWPEPRTVQNPQNPAQNPTEPRNPGQYTQIRFHEIFGGRKTRLFDVPRGDSCGGERKNRSSGSELVFESPVPAFRLSAVPAFGQDCLLALTRPDPVGHFAFPTDRQKH
jgi:hypothetical protein